MVHRHKHALQMEEKRLNNVAAGLVSERFPSVSAIVIHMTYYRNAVIPLLMVRTVNMVPTTYAYFKMDCMVKGCSSGGFDLTPVVTNMVKTGKKVGKGSLKCHGNIDAVPSSHASIDYEAVIEYQGI